MAIYSSFRLYLLSTKLSFINVKKLNLEDFGIKLIDSLEMKANINVMKMYLRVGNRNFAFGSMYKKPAKVPETPKVSLLIIYKPAYCPKFFPC